MLKLLYLLLALVAAMLIWIRVAPSDEARWHVDPQVSADQDLVGGVRRKLDGDQAVLAKLHGVILATPRTSLLAGSVDGGHLTYVSRSKLIGFPDYTSVKLGDAGIEIFGRLRFGKSDMGVNKARVEGWLSQL